MLSSRLLSAVAARASRSGVADLCRLSSRTASSLSLAGRTIVSASAALPQSVSESELVSRRAAARPFSSSGSTASTVDGELDGGVVGAGTAVGADTYTLDDIMDSVIKVYSTAASPNYLLPWQNKPMRDHTGSGFVIAGKRIITDAHVVADAIQVMVRRPGSAVKFPARVVAAGHDCDLAVLEVDSDDFWEPLKNKNFGAGSPLARALDAPPSDVGLARQTGGGATAAAAPTGAAAEAGASETAVHGYGGLRFSDEIPHLQQNVYVVGYPIGGDNVCITQGVVSRVEPVMYAHAASNLLAVQIDAAINPGNSGGPAFIDGHVVGVAFQNIQNANNVGYIIPVPIIRHFLRDVDAGGYRVSTPDSLLFTMPPLGPDGKPKAAAPRRGFCILGVIGQGTSGEAFQRHLGMLPALPSPVPKGGSAVSPAAAAAEVTPALAARAALLASSSSSSSSSASGALAPASAAPGQAVLDAVSAATGAPEAVRPLFERAPLPAAYAHFPPALARAAANATAARNGRGFGGAPTAAPNSSATAFPGASPVSAAGGAAAAASAGSAWQQPLTGVCVNRVEPMSSSGAVLRRHDVLLAVDGHPLACDGTVPFRGRERISFDYLVSLKHEGDTTRLTFLRRAAAPADPFAAGTPVEGVTAAPAPAPASAAADPAVPARASSFVRLVSPGVELHEADVTMRPSEMLSPIYEYDRAPSYFVFGGVVMVPLSQPYLHEFGKDWYTQAPRELVSLAIGGARVYECQQPVVLAQLLPSECTLGFNNMHDSHLRRVNGIEIRNLAHVRRVIERAILRAARLLERDAIAQASPSSTPATGDAATDAPLAPLPVAGAHAKTGCSAWSPYHKYLLHTGLTLRTDPAEELAREGLRTYAEDEADPADAPPTPNNATGMPQLAVSPATGAETGKLLPHDAHTLTLELQDFRVIVLDLRLAASTHAQILAKHRVPSDRSADL